MTNARILIVESAKCVAEDIAERLTGLGYTICATVPSRVQAIAKVAEMRPSLVLINTKLKGKIEGIEAAQEIYDRFDIPVVYLVDNNSSEDLLKTVKVTRAFGYVFKPYLTDQLQLSIEENLYWHKQDQQLRDRESWLSTVLNSIGDAIIVTDQGGFITFINPIAQLLTGWQLDEASSVHITHVFNVIIGNKSIRTSLMNLLHKGTIIDQKLSMVGQSISLITKSGRKVFISFNALPLRNYQGNINGVVVAFRDITEFQEIRNQLEQTVTELQNQAQLMETVFNGISDGILAVDTNGKYLVSNKSIDKLVGKKLIQGLAIAQRPKTYGLFYSDQKTLFRGEDLPLTRAMLGEETDKVEMFVRNPNIPEGIFINVTGRPLYEPNGQMKGGVILVHDVTRLKRTEQELEATVAELRNQTQLMETIFNSISEGVVVTDENGEFLLVNPEAEQIVGMGATKTSPNEWAEKYGTFYPDEVTPFPSDQLPLRRAIHGEHTEAVNLFIRNQRRPNGVHINVSGSPLKSDKETVKGGVIVFRNITPIKKAEDRLEKTINQLRNQTQLMETIFNSINDGIIVADEAGALTVFNPSAQRIANIDLARIGLQQSQINEWVENFGLFHKDKVTPFLTSDLPLVRAIRGEDTDNVEMFVRNPNTSEGIFISVNGRPIRDESGIKRGGVIVCRDITEQKLSEEELNRAFAQGRLEIVETILHNIGNSINSITAGIETAYMNLQNNRLIHRFSRLASAIKIHEDDWSDYIKNDSQGQQVLPFILGLAEDFAEQNRNLLQRVERARRKATHIADIVNTQKLFSNVSVMYKNINVQQAISEAVKLQQDSLNVRGIQPDIDCENAPREIRTQESQFHQMLVNLIKNSIEAIDERVQLGSLNETPRIYIKTYINGDFFYLEVTDNGIGIVLDPSIDIFAAGYTTKKSGNGFGLYSIANFVTGSGGRINPLSEGIGKGTTMQIMLRCSTVLPTTVSKK